MVITHVIDSLEVGGAEAVVASLCRYQAERGHRVSVHCLLKGGMIAEKLRAAKIPVHVHGPSRPLARLWRLYRVLARERPDVVHCHNKSAAVHAAALARLAGARGVLVTRHGLAALPYRLRKDLKFWAIASVFCDWIVAVCETARRNMIAGASPLAHKIVTVRNGAQPPEAHADQMPNEVLRGGFTLISVGRLVRAKDFATLLRSVALARAHVADMVLWILGDGPESGDLKRLATELGVADITHFLGERQDVGRWLSRADVFVLSSLTEGLPISVVEAICAGVPIIATEVGGIPEVIELCGVGATVPVGDPEVFANAIIEFATRRESLPHWREQSRRCYEKHFTPQRMVQDYLNLYDDCLQHTRG